jgi:hypothetical protein
VKARHRRQAHDFVHGKNLGFFHHAIDHKAVFGRVDVPPTLVVTLEVEATGSHDAKQ